MLMVRYCLVELALLVLIKIANVGFASATDRRTEVVLSVSGFALMVAFLVVGVVMVVHVWRARRMDDRP